MFVVAKQENGLRGTNSCIKCSPIQIFATGWVGQQNGMKPSKTWVLDLKYWIGHVCCKKQETSLEAKTRALNVPRYWFLQCVKCGYGMAWNHPKHEFHTWNSALVVTKLKMVLEAWTRALNAPRCWFHNRLGAAMKWREATQKTSFRQEGYGAKPNWHFRASKWCENTQNFSFRPKGVDWNLSCSMSRVLLFW
jgi:hypothetical protein